MEMVLAKSDMAIAERYAALVEDQALRDARSSAGSATAGSGRMTACCDHRPDRGCSKSIPRSMHSIRLRLPYIEPLNLLQIELIKRHRAGEEDARIGEGILLSINAIATGRETQANLSPGRERSRGPCRGKVRQ